MFSRTKIALSAATIVLSTALPGPAATKHHRVTHVHPAIYNMVPGYNTQTQWDYSNSPAATGGGSLGYNQNLLNDY
jgi:hypothetical protein